VSSRYSICVPATSLEERFSVEVSPGYTPRFNAAPGQLLPVITNTGPNGISFFYWGLDPKWAKNKPISDKIINVQAELIPDKTSSRKSLEQRRCLVPADGFYEWKRVGKKITIPYRYVLKSKALFSIAALWEEYEDEEEKESYHTFTMITVPANNSVLVANERMPAILQPEDEKIWLSNSGTMEDWLSVLKTYPGDLLDNYSISPRINSLTPNDAGLILPAPPADQFGNLTLFD
jgi:putative SOS response-associated peptidase YedK